MKNLIIEIQSTYAGICTMEGESIIGSKWESDVLDCTTSGDCWDACEYVLDHVGVEFRTVALDPETGKYENRIATSKEKQLCCEEIYFDHEPDEFSDETKANIYLIWEAANSCINS